MILGDFGGPGVHFLMIFEARGLILEAWRPILTIFWIFSEFGDFTPLKKESLFGSFFDTFWMQSFKVFWVLVFFCFFCDSGCPMAPKWGPSGGHFEDIFDDRLFLDFCYPYCTKPWFLKSGGYPNRSFFVTFLRVFWAKPLEHDFEDFHRFWVPWGRPFGSKKASKKRPKTVVKNGAASHASNRLWAL